MENMQNYNIEDNNIQQSPQKKEKLKWWIPLLFFLGGILMVVCSLVTEIICRSQEDFILDYQLIDKYPIIITFRRLAAVCWFLVIPSLIYIIVKYNKKSTEEKNQENNQIYSLINNATTLDEKLLIAYIGNNYQKIILQKFSIPALLSWLYTLYRKVYIPSIIGMIIILILKFLPNNIYTIIAFVFIIILCINFNKWYIAYVKNKIQKIKTNNPNANESELINICIKKGGTNIWIAILIYFAFIIIESIL